jgi:Flp pilus assembly pilin Flp
MDRKRFADRGASAVEYAVLLTLIAVVCLGAVGLAGKAVGGRIGGAAEVLGVTQTTVAGNGTTTTTAAPTTTRPVGVPNDWPANKPIPPMPDNCRQPQLEDNGRWNCQR